MNTANSKVEPVRAQFCCLAACRPTTPEIEHLRLILGVGGAVTPKIKHECLISRVLGVVESGGSGAGLEKAHNL